MPVTHNNNTMIILVDIVDPAVVLVCPAALVADSILGGHQTYVQIYFFFTEKSSLLSFIFFVVYLNRINVWFRVNWCGSNHTET